MVIWFTTLGVLGVHRSSASRACSRRCSRASGSRCSRVIRPRARDSRRRVPRGHRRRGALCRHGPLRRAARPARVVHARLARRCCSTTSAKARCCSRGGRSRIRSSRSRRAPRSVPRAARDGRDDHRVAGEHLRRVLAHAPGRAARSAAARDDPADVVGRARPDLCAGRQRVDVRRRHGLRAGVPVIGAH